MTWNGPYVHNAWWLGEKERAKDIVLLCDALEPVRKDSKYEFIPLESNPDTHLFKIWRDEFPHVGPSVKLWERVSAWSSVCL